MGFQLAEAYVEFGSRGVSTVMGAANAIKDKIFSVAAAITRPIRNLAGWVLNLLNPMNLLRSTLGKIAAAAGAVGVALSARGIAQAFATQEQAETKLRGALEANGRAVRALMADYKAFASQRQRETVVGDETTLGMLQQAEALGLTGEAAKRAVTEAIGLARALGMAEKSAVRYTASLAEGDTTMLNRYLPVLKEIDDQATRVAKAHELLANMFGVATEEANSNTGAYQQMKNAIGDIMEKIGETFAEVFDMKGRYKNVKEFAERFWDRFGVPIRNTFITIKTAANTAWDGIKAGFEAARDYITGLFPNFESGFRDTFKTIADHLDVMLGSWEGFRDGIIHITLQTTYALQTIWQKFRKRFTHVWDAMRATAELAWEWIDSRGKPDAAKTMADALVRVNKDLIDNLLSEDRRYQEARKKIDEKILEDKEEWAKAMANAERVSTKFGQPPGETPPFIGEPSWSPADDTPGQKTPPSYRFGLTSLAGLADTMQAEAGKRLAERNANANQQTAEGVAELVRIQQEKDRLQEAYWQGSLALHSPSIGG
jgi:hypothetical protein